MAETMYNLGWRKSANGPSYNATGKQYNIFNKFTAT